MNNSILLYKRHPIRYIMVFKLKLLLKCTIGVGTLTYFWAVLLSNYADYPATEKKKERNNTLLLPAQLRAFLFLSISPTLVYTYSSLAEFTPICKCLGLVLPPVTLHPWGLTLKCH